MSEFHLLRPLWLLALVPILLLAVMAWRRRMGESVWKGLVDAHLLPHLLVGGASGERRRLPILAFALVGCLVTLALAGPVWERLPQPVFTTSAQRIVLLDLSPSMNAADVPPSRLARARFEIQDLLKASREGQVGLIAFGPEPFVVSPLTGDARTIAAQVPQLSSDLIPVPGPRRTDLALKLAGEMLDRAKSGAGDLILVTDGVGAMAGSLEQARDLAAKGRHLSVLAVGTAKGAPVPDPQGGFVKDADGRIRMAALDTKQLSALARAGGGRFLTAKVGEGDTKALLAAASSLTETVEKSDLVADRWREEGPWLLLLVLPLAALAFRRGWLLPVLVLACVLPPSPSYAFGWSDLWSRTDQQAARQLEAGDAAGAAERFADPAWRAAASYRAGRYDQALESLEGQQGPEADYNRGNALARLGRLEEAADAYEDTLKQVPDHADAKHNLELVRNLLNQQEESKQDSESSENQDSESSDVQSQQDRSQQGQSGQDSPDRDQGAEQGQQDNAGQSENQDPSGKRSGSQGQGSETQGEGQASGERPQGSEADGSSGDADSSEEQAASEAGQAKPQEAGAEPGAEDFSQKALGSASGQPDDAGQPSDEEGRVPRRLQAARSDSEAERDAPQVEGGSEDLTPEERERQQAMEAQLRSVPDDPAGLLRQRFLLQHLRREGRLP
ncbi:VWA domain-containing protein [Imhoffiella purpurea]|uniref:TPR domain protein n=1 Tax=Imhoffiella purpurea TaxID=1249627 RepID=W9V7H5_9GAMM|nr:VWA domain-containing protein [Imhoffiella purpurea]EXJ15354.1 TPR domain protein [Imhoffiella purpurea]